MHSILTFRSIPVLFLTLAVVLTSADAGILRRKPKVRGRIGTITATPSPDALARGVLGELLVLGYGEKDLNKQQVWVHVTSKTKISGVRLSRPSFAVLAAGMAVEVKFEGKLSKTYPVTGVAKSIEILDPSYIVR